MNIAIIGKDGQLARALALTAPAQMRPFFFGRPGLDLAAAQPDLEQLLRLKPRLVINAAAYTQVDKAETEVSEAFSINRYAPATLASFCYGQGAALIHISTDYVFDGTKRGPYAEDDAPNPLSVYGESKLAGEDAVRSLLAEHIILRTSWVFSPYGQNFAKTMLRLARTQSSVRIVADQFGRPTAAADLAVAIWRLAGLMRDWGGQGFPWGTYHFALEPAASWAEFADEIFSQAAPYLGGRPQIQPIASAEYATAARRPQNSVLDCRKITRMFGISPRSWRPALQEMLQAVHDEAHA